MYRANSYCPEFAPVQKSRDNSSEHGIGIRQATVRQALPSSVIVSCVSKSNMEANLRVTCLCGECMLKLILPFVFRLSCLRLILTQIVV